MNEADRDISAVFFDFGGVVSSFNQAEVSRLEEQYGLPASGLLQVLYEIPEWKTLELGNGSEEAWLAAGERKLAELAGRPVPEFREEWSQVRMELDRDIVALAERLRGRYRVGMISNATLELEEILRDQHGIDHLFDIVVNSARVGVAKPDARIFNLAAERAGVEPRTCLLIDDLPQNVLGAREAGFQAIRYEGDY
ncbi:MAG: HAD family phosphatase, partial [Dehalococcoidia bacterium]